MNETQSFPLATTFSTKVHSKTARVGVIGMGYVGLPLGLLFARKGFRVTGFDIDNAKVQKLEKGESYMGHIHRRGSGGAVKHKEVSKPPQISHLVSELDAVLICVPTPLGVHREPDLSFIRNTAEAIAPHLRSGQLVVLESTTYPGTTKEAVVPSW